MKEKEPKEIQELIKKFNIEVIIKDGQEMLRVRGRKPGLRQVEKIKGWKPLIIEEIKRQKEEKDREWEERQRKIEEETEKRRVEYLKTADLRRCLVVLQDEYMNERWSIETLEFKDGKAWKVDYCVDSNYKGLAGVTETVERIIEEKEVGYGLFGAAWEITPEQEEKLLKESDILREQKLQEKKIERQEAERRQQEVERKRQEALKEREEILKKTEPHKGSRGTCSYCGRPGAVWSRRTAKGVKYACGPECQDDCLDKLMKEHEAWAESEGMVRCWECGLYKRPEELDENGYCGC